MNTILFCDTETTGLPDFKAPSEAEHQPHIVQLAACLVDADTQKDIASMDVIIRPDNWVIPDEIAKIHGITTERAMGVGIPESMAVDMIMALWKSRLRVAHNEQFDARIIRIALKRFTNDATADHWKSGYSKCTAILATPFCQIPPTPKMVAAGFNRFKTANLKEAHQHFLGCDFENAHSAMADVQACIKVYFSIKEKGFA